MKLRQRLGYRSSYTTRPRRPRACGTCGIAGHNAARCDVRARLDQIWDAEQRAFVQVRVPKGVCGDCFKRPKAVRLIFANGETSWVCRPCAELWRAVARLTGRTPEYEPVPALDMVK